MQRLRTSSKLIGSLRPLSGARSRRNFCVSSSRSKSVIVTGAAQGVGKAISLQLAEDGYDVCVNDFESQKQALDELSHSISTTHNRKAISVIGDVTSPTAMETLVATSVDNLSLLDTMVSNAGIARTASVLELAPKDHERLFTVNYFGVYNSHRAAALQLLKQGKKSKGMYKLIVAASAAALRPGPFISAYSATKSAVRNLSQSFAQELGHAGITSNCYAPGVVGTQMWQEVDSDVGDIRGQDKGSLMQEVAGNAVLGRVSVAEHVSGTVSWLASDKSDFVTGQCVLVDGGSFFT